MATGPSTDSADYTACDREPIHTPGSIQPHGFLIALEPATLKIAHASDNLFSFTGQQAAQAVGGTLAQAVGEDNGRWLLAAAADQRIEARPTYLGTVRLTNGAMFDVLAHSWKDLLVFEFEAANRETPADFRLLYPLITKFVAQLADAADIEGMSAVAVREIKQLTGFGRVLLYRFDEEQHGEVLAELIDEGYHSYLNQRFPASDIPQQARALYVANRVRLIADAGYVPSRLVPGIDASGAPVDLTYASLRSVSPVHVQYMKNMGTMASMSVSIVVRGKLWGLVSCHHTQPRSVSFEGRAACEQLGQILALHLEAREERSEFNHRLELRGMLVRMLAALTQSTNFSDNIVNVSDDLLKFANASGAALIFEGNATVFGKTPSVQQLDELVDWLNDKVQGDIYHTDCLSREYEGAEEYKAIASGMLVLSISQMHRHYLIWLRPEFVQTIDWAGNPHLKMTPSDPANTLAPRESFDAWREIVHGVSLPWRQSEIDTALEFRTAILGIVLQRAEEMAAMAESLGRANKELESFSYSVSHDLRSPLRHIVGFTDLLIEMEKEQLSERGVRFLHNIKNSARFAGKLVDDLLSFSQMGRAALRPSQVDMNDIVHGAIGKLEADIGDRSVQWFVDPLPAINGDPAFLQLAVQNLLSNAVKYTRPREHAEIRISAEEQEEQTVFHVRDNGVGFDARYVHKLFGVFQRLHRMEEFEGTGIGLANVKRIIERHGGEVWADAVVNEGAVFSFSIPKQLPTED
jgi:light-regulated signal transduction histidine kinase (bacteriophytochrome)